MIQFGLNRGPEEAFMEPVRPFNEKIRFYTCSTIIALIYFTTWTVVFGVTRFYAETACGNETLYIFTIVGFSLLTLSTVLNALCLILLLKSKDGSDYFPSTFSSFMGARFLGMLVGIGAVYSITETADQPGCGMLYMESCVYLGVTGLYLLISCVSSFWRYFSVRLSHLMESNANNNNNINNPNNENSTQHTQPDQQRINLGNAPEAQNLIPNQQPFDGPVVGPDGNLYIGEYMIDPENDF
jgi:hypothetical protein